MKKRDAILLATLSGILLSVAWPANGWAYLLFVALLPLFYIEQKFYEDPVNNSRIRLFFYTYITFFVWNALTTYWVSFSTIFGGIMAVVLNAFLMTVVFYAYHVSRAITHNRSGQFILLFFWIAWEYFHLDWDLSWPWLNLGNGFSAYPQLVQWYEYTGVFGGTAWILTVNILLFRAVYFYFKEGPGREILAHGLLAIIFIVAPIVFSLNIYNNYHETENPAEVVVLQPNLDPYTEQYEKSPEEVLNHIFDLAAQKSDSETRFIVAPESAIQEKPLYENNLHRGKSIKMLKDFIAENPNKAIVIGASTYYIFDDDEEIPLSARKFSNAEKYYNAYNTAIYIDDTNRVQLYHKSKLTPGVEKMPFKKLFKHIENFAIDLGGTVGTLGTDPERIPFTTNKGHKIAPVICYESIYGDFTAGFIRNGAEAIFIITNDGWWGDTPGHRQHLQFASLRAIETRRSIARSANTGISAFINQRGDIAQATAYWEEDVIKQSINLNDEKTFYVKHGDYIARIAVFGTVMLLLITITGVLMRRSKGIIR